MVLKSAFSFIFCLLVLVVYGQHPHVPLLSDTWKLLETAGIKTNSAGVSKVYFPPDLLAKNKKQIELPGYMVPIKTGLTHQDFMLSVLPVLQCQFCGQSNIPAMVAVHMTKPIPFSEKPINVKGMLILNGADESLPEFFIFNGVLED